MTTYRVGQRVRIEWPDGTAVEGYLQKDACVVKYANRHYSDIVVAERDGATITVLSEPRPEEPTGLGAVVEADDNRPEKEGRTRWVRFRGYGLMALPEWCTEDGCRSDYWPDLIDPVVLFEGWTP